VQQGLCDGYRRTKQQQNRLLLVSGILVNPY
jgi:hypothetical protein